jgi:tetratricopeptide (TPR) repeat protein
MPDVFVSHATKDDERVSDLHDALEAATKTDLWVDHKDIPAGAPWETSIERALKDCAYCLVVLSRHAIVSEEVRAEWRAAITYSHAVLPVIIDDVPFEDIPPRLRSFQFVPMRTADEWAVGIQKLTDAILGRAAPGADGDAPQFTRWPITGELPRELLKIPMHGRDADLAHVLAAVQAGPTSIVGVGGLGKSRLAAESVLTSAEARGAIWHRCTATSIPGEIVALLRQHFGLPPEAPEHEVLRRLETQRRMIVIDNGESVLASDPRRNAYAALVERLAGHGAHILLTSRTEWTELRPPRRKHEPHPLDLPSAVQATREIAAAYGVNLADGRAEALAEAARFHPGMIDWALNQIEGGRRYEQVLGWLQGGDRARLAEPLDALIRTTLDDMLKEEADGLAALALLRRLCVFAGVFDRAAALAVNLTPKSPLPGARGLEDEFDDALVILKRWRFVREVADGRYALPPIVTTALEADDDAYAAHFAHYHALHGDYDANNDETRHPLITRDFDELRAALAWGETHEQRQAADLAHALTYYMQLHQPYPIWRAVLESGQRAARTAGYAGGEANTLQALGDLDLREARYGAARANYEAALSAFRAIPDRLGEANTLQALGDLDLREARYGAARANYEAALSAFRAIPARLGEANTLQGLGNLLQAEEDWEQALTHFKEAIHIFRSIGDRYSYGAVCTDMQPTLLALQRYDNALRSALDALAIDSEIGVARYVEIDQDAVRRIQNEIGSDAFAAAWRTVTGTDDLPDWLE